MSKTINIRAKNIKTIVIGSGDTGQVSINGEPVERKTRKPNVSHADQAAEFHKMHEDSLSFNEIGDQFDTSPGAVGYQVCRYGTTLYKELWLEAKREIRQLRVENNQLRNRVKELEAGGEETWHSA